MAILATGVTKVSGKVADTSGEVVLTAADVGAPVNRSSGTTDCDSLLFPGHYNVTGGTTNWAFGGSGGAMYVFNHGDGYVTQLATHGALNQLKVRTKNASTWSGWADIYSSDVKPTAADIRNVVSPVSSGGIIERGSNANGEYVKFADGTMICTHRATLPNVTLSAIGTWYRGPISDLTTASTFVGSVSVSGVFINKAGEFAAGLAVTSGSKLSGYFVSAAPDSGGAPQFTYTAIGRWK